MSLKNLSIAEMARDLCMSEERVVQMVWERNLNPEDVKESDDVVTMAVRIVLWEVWKHERGVADALGEIHNIRRV